MAETIDLKYYLMNYWQYLIIGVLLVALIFYFNKYIEVKEMYNVLVEEHNMLHNLHYGIS